MWKHSDLPQRRLKHTQSYQPAIVSVNMPIQCSLKIDISKNDLNLSLIIKIIFSFVNCLQFIQALLIAVEEIQVSHHFKHISLINRSYTLLFLMEGKSLVASRLKSVICLRQSLDHPLLRLQLCVFAFNNFGKAEDHGPGFFNISQNEPLLNLAQ